MCLLIFLSHGYTSVSKRFLKEECRATFLIRSAIRLCGYQRELREYFWSDNCYQHRRLERRGTLLPTASWSMWFLSLHRYLNRRFMLMLLSAFHPDLGFLTAFCPLDDWMFLPAVIKHGIALVFKPVQRGSAYRDGWVSYTFLLDL
jgi:hypothetical protein